MPDVRNAYEESLLPVGDEGHGDVRLTGEYTDVTRQQEFVQEVAELLASQGKVLAVVTEGNLEGDNL